MRILVCIVWRGEPPCMIKSNIQGGFAEFCSFAHCCSDKILLRMSACWAKG